MVLVVVLLLILLILLYILFKPPTAPPAPKVNTTDSRRADLEFKKLCPPRTGDKYAVIGVGMVGHRIVHRLLERGENSIVCFDISDMKIVPDCPEIKKVRGSILDAALLKSALEGVDTVFLTAAYIGFHHRFTYQYPLSYKTNVLGADAVINACAEAKVKRLIYTSTSNVTVGSHTTRLNMDEYTEYVSNPINHYIRTKIIAERMVLQANNKNNLCTVAIRPCSGIFGEGDNILLKPKLEMKLGVVYHGDAAIDFIYVDNVVYSQLLAEQKMRDFRTLQQIAGQYFCVTNGQPMTHWEFNQRLKHFYPDMRIVPVSTHIVQLIGFLVDCWSFIFRGIITLGDFEKMSGVGVHVVSLTNTFKDDKAREVLGYKPIYSVDEGMHQCVASFLASKKSKTN